MTCQECQQLLSPYLDNVLTADERQSTAQHVAQCTTCTNILHQLEQNRKLLHRLPTIEVSSAMEQRLQRKVQSLKPVLSTAEGSKIQGLQSAIRNPQSAIVPWWRSWRFVSVGTLATGAAAFLFYFSTIQAPPDVSAEEVASSMEELIDVLDPNDAELLLEPDIPEEPETDWQQEVDSWFFDYDATQE